MRKPTTEGGPDRLVALSDGVFAIAITLLVLDIQVPQGLDSDGFHEALRDVLPNLGAYAISLAVLAASARPPGDLPPRAAGGRRRDLADRPRPGPRRAAAVPHRPGLRVRRRTHLRGHLLGGGGLLGAVHLALAVVVARRPWLHGDAEPCGTSSSTPSTWGSWWGCLW
ncbi:TMEM175 family protein [Streptomyces thermocarboxydus]